MLYFRVVLTGGQIYQKTGKFADFDGIALLESPAHRNGETR